MSNSGAHYTRSRPARPQENAGDAQHHRMHRRRCQQAGHAEQRRDVFGRIGLSACASQSKPAKLNFSNVIDAYAMKVPPEASPECQRPL
jgi:hypothetical protein